MNPIYNKKKLWVARDGDDKYENISHHVSTTPMRLDEEDKSYYGGDEVVSCSQKEMFDLLGIELEEGEQVEIEIEVSEVV